MQGESEMVFIFTALYPEAKPLIKKFGLKKRIDSTRFQQFVPEEYLKASDLLKKNERGKQWLEKRPEILLVITGVGPINASASISSVLTEYAACSTDMLLSFGTAAALHSRVKGIEDSSVYIINKLLDSNSHRSFYPDMLVKCDMKEASMITGSMVLSEEDVKLLHIEAADYDLYDMEAAAAYQAGAFYVGPHQMSFIRVVTDSGVGDDPGEWSESVTKAVEKHVDKIFDYVDKIKRISEIREKNREIFCDEELFLVEKIIQDAHFSKVMQDQFVQNLRYAVLSGIEWREMAEKMYEEGMIPTKDKREGKKVLDAFRSSFTE